MTSEASAEAVSQVPLWLTLLSIFGATLVGGAITSISNWVLQRGQQTSAIERARLEHERDQARWLRERRFEAYRRFLVDSDLTGISMRRAGGDGRGVKLTSQDYEEGFAAVNAIGLIGPSDLYQLALECQNVAHGELTKGGDRINWTAITHARTKVAARMQELLGVPIAERVVVRAEQDS